MKLNTIRDNPGAKTERKRVGRGLGSGLGKTSGVGQKGQKARSGVAVRAFEGGQMPLYRRLPKRGFKSHNRACIAVVNLGQLQLLTEAGLLDAKIPLNAESLSALGLIRKGADKIKLLAKGDINVALNIQVDAASAKAIEKAQAAGGTVTLSK